jgi:predicted secreted protein
MVSLVCGVAAYIVTFALALFCVRHLQVRRNAKEDLPPHPGRKNQIQFR